MRLWANEILFGPQLSKIKSTQAFINAYYVPSTVISVFHTLKKKSSQLLYLESIIILFILQLRKLRLRKFK